MSKRLCAFVRRINRDTARRSDSERRALLRLDMTDVEYVDWFISGKIDRGFVNPAHALNDFVLFRLAHEWPKNAQWFLEAKDILAADFGLTAEMAVDLIDMAADGLSDGYRPADWYLRIAVTWYADNALEMPGPLMLYLQKALFLQKKTRKGRKRRDGIDRDRIIRNAFEGLRARECPTEKAQEIIADRLAMSHDAVRKLIARTPRTEREARLWGTLTLRWQSVERDTRT